MPYISRYLFIFLVCMNQIFPGRFYVNVFLHVHMQMNLRRHLRIFRTNELRQKQERFYCCDQQSPYLIIRIRMRAKPVSCRITSGEVNTSAGFPCFFCPTTRFPFEKRVARLYRPDQYLSF